LRLARNDKAAASRRLAATRQSLASAETLPPTLQELQAQITLAEHSKTCYYLPYATITNDSYSYR
jgi:hypothetical protein